MCFSSLQNKDNRRMGLLWKLGNICHIMKHSFFADHTIPRLNKSCMWAFCTNCYNKDPIKSHQVHNHIVMFKYGREPKKIVYANTLILAFIVLRATIFCLQIFFNKSKILLKKANKKWKEIYVEFIYAILMSISTFYASLKFLQHVRKFKLKFLGLWGV